MLGQKFHGSRNEKMIALTFDLCPSHINGGYDSVIIRTLVDSGVPATFFLSGKWIKNHKRNFQELTNIPIFEFANHSFSHPHFTSLSDDSIRKEIVKTEHLFKHIKSSSRFFRPPYGEINRRVDSIVQSLGLTSVLYDVISGDPDSTFSKERLFRSVKSQTQNGSIIVMHANGKGWRTPETLPQIIQSLREKGYKFVQVSELFKTPQVTKRI